MNFSARIALSITHLIIPNNASSLLTRDLCLGNGDIFTAVNIV